LKAAWRNDVKHVQLYADRFTHDQSW